MRRLLRALVAVAFVASMATSAMAVINWQLVGTSGYSETNVAGMNDPKRLHMSGMTVDSAGNVYAIVNNAENGGYAYTNPATGGAPYYYPIPPNYVDKDGGITIFRADGTKQDLKWGTLVDNTWGTRIWGPDFTHPRYGFRTDNKVGGGITKLVTGGDGNVYALVNWEEIEWGYARQNQRIVQIKPDGTMTNIWSPAGPNAGGGLDPQSSDQAWHQTARLIRGMTVGGDGNIYWTMNGADNYWKYHTLWRYDVISQQIEEAPVQAPVGSFSGNQGWSITMRMFDLEYVGNDYFAMVNTNTKWNGGYVGDTYEITSIKWDKGTQVTDSHGWGNTDWPGTRHGGAPLVYGSTQREDFPTFGQSGWGHDWLTAMAFDPARNKLWVGGRGDGSGPFSYAGSGSVSVADLGSGNKGVQFAPTAAGDQLYYDRTAPRPTGKLEITTACRFKLTSKTADYNGAILVNIPDSKTLGSTVAGPRIAVAADPATGKWQLVDTSEPNAPVALANLGNVELDKFNEVYVYVKDKLTTSDTSRVICWWNGSQVYDSATGGAAYNEAATGPYVQFGARCNWPWANRSGNATVVMDWAAYAEGKVAPGDPWPKLPIAGYMDGSTYFDAYINTNIVTCFNGTPGAPGLFTGLVETSDDPATQTVTWGTAGVQSYNVYHANENDPTTSGVPNAGRYWINSIAVNPDDGSAWMSWSADPYYSYPDRGRVMIRALGDAAPYHAPVLFDAGEPEAGADVVAMKFVKPDADTTVVYALTCNRTTGAYNLYKAEATASNPFDYFQYVPLELAKFHRQGVMFSTGPVVVTLSQFDPAGSFFYVESLNERGVPVSGIKVVLANDGLTLPSVGDTVNLTGRLQVVNGEAQIQTFGIDPVGTGSVTPLTMLCRSVGGDEAGAQPALTPVYGPSNVGLLVKVVGTVTAIDPTDEWTPKWFTVDDSTGGTSYYLDGAGDLQTVQGLKVRMSPLEAGVSVGDFVTVVGVSSVDALIDYPFGLPPVVRGYQRSILPRDYSDVARP